MSEPTQDTTPEQPVQTQSEQEGQLSSFHEQSLPAGPANGGAPRDESPSRVETHDHAVQSDQTTPDPVDLVNPKHVEDNDPESLVGEPDAPDA